ncbi:GIN domain-containing protein [Brevundimonas sp.]|uniref:GIN domain-containing protein n=1 Tax=Brevundimonas sp. TaxID=1871086 RepID=UPI00289799CD|nr:DUF2807 domain-containing protein [Brevundimonas sp.]
MNIRTTVCMGVATAALLVAGSASAQSVKIENAVARVIYVVEDRRDIAIEVSNETGATPALQMSRSGDDITIRGNIGGRRNTIRINECHSGRSRAPQSSPGEGASVTIEGRRVALSDAPMIVVRGPRTVKISTTGAVFGSIGRGAQSVELGSGGCGDWVVANVSGASDISIGGSGQVWSGSAQRLKVAIGGSGDVRAGRVEALEVAIGGSGDVTVQEVNGPVSVAIAGSGDVSVSGGRVSDLSAQIVGSGDVDIATTVQDASVGIMGSGDVRIQRVTGNVSKRIAGSGEVRIARQS